MAFGLDNKRDSMTKNHLALAIPASEMPTQLSSNNLELRLLPYWKGVKHFRTSVVSEQMTPQDYYWTIISSNKNPTLVNGKVVAFNSRADMYFSRIPPHIIAKLWRNFGVHPQSTVSSR
jgi:hypothetical protein